MHKEIRTLTGLRGLAACIVMLYHFLENDAWFLGHVPALIKRGYLGVDVFFVLSGFVMALSYARYFAHTITLSEYRSFMIKRLARIYPLYIFITLVFLVKYALNLSGAGKGGFHLPDFIACAAMIQAWGFGFGSVAGSTWSLSTEFFAYIVFPPLVFATVFARPLHAVLVFMLSVGCLCAVVASHTGVSGPMDVVASSSILPLLRCMAGFCLGLLCYRLSLSDGCRRYLRPSAAVVGLLLGLLLAAHFEAHDLILFAFFPPLVLALFCQSAFAKLIFANGAAYHLGVVSYSLYLVHPLFVPLKARLAPLAERSVGGAAHLLTLGLVVLLSWGFACALYRLVEMPGRILVQRLLLRRRAAQPV